MVGPWFFSKPAYTQLQEILKVDNANTGISADGDDNSATQAPFVIFPSNLQISIWQGLKNLAHEVNENKMNFQFLDAVQTAEGQKIIVALSFCPFYHRNEKI